MNRYVLSATPKDISQHFGIQECPAHLCDPTFNAAPGQALPVILSNHGEPTVSQAIWDSSNPKIVAEEVQKQEHIQRCIVPAQRVLHVETNR